jgi:acyl transferase domain-containing protein
VAVDAACKALRHGDSAAAAVVGVNLLMGFPTFISFSAAGTLSRKGRCATFSVYGLQPNIPR